jgi:Uri superfamily endonuclease
MTGLRKERGTYAVLMELDRPRTFAVVGEYFRDVHLPAGHYVYVGSAFGSGGVRARVGRHLGYSAPPRWNIDHVRRAMVMREVWYTYDAEKRECSWARGVFHEALAGSVIVPKFGSWDCFRSGPADRCPTHFLRYDRPPSWEAFRAAIDGAIVGHADVHRLEVPASCAAAGSLLRSCESALRRGRYGLAAQRTADGLYARFVHCFHVDSDWPVIGTRSMDGRDVFVYRGRKGDVWTLDSGRVSKAGDWVAGPLQTLVLPGTHKGVALVRQARSDGLELIEAWTD